MALPAAVVTIGTEIVSGEVSNENGRWLAQRLEARGVAVEIVVAIPDDADRIGDVVRWARMAHDVVFVTGGLGPTPDDVTREGIAAAFGVTLQPVPDPEQELLARGGHCAAFAHVWAQVPTGARLLLRLSDGAPTFAIGNVYVLAGQPEEMHSTFLACLSELPQATPLAVFRRTTSLPEHVVLPTIRRVVAAFPWVTIGSYPHYD